MTDVLIPKIVDHADQAIARLANEFKDKPNIEGLIRAFVEQNQDEEDLLYKYFTAFDLRYAIGAQLDIIGAIVGQSRQGRADDEYRIAIYTKIAINICKGTADEVIAIFSLVTGATVVQLLEYFPGHVHIFGNVNFEWDLIGDGPDAFAFEGGIDGLGFGDLFDPTIGGPFCEIVFFDVAPLYRLMDSCLAGGVRLDFLGWFSATPFSFEGDPAGLGFGDFFDSTIGGNFATIVLPS